MARDPAFLFFPDDWLGGTMGLTYEAKGAYIDLLVFQFNNYHFTEAQAKHVLSICFANVWDMIKNKFKNEGENGEFLYNQRLRLEMEKRKRFSESRRINALHPKKERKRKIKKEKAYAQHMGNGNGNIILEDKSIIKKELYGEFILLTYEEYHRLLKDYGQNNLQKMLDKLNNYFGADQKRLKKYTSHNHVLRGWVADELKIVKLSDSNNLFGDTYFCKICKKKKSTMSKPNICIDCDK